MAFDDGDDTLETLNVSRETRERLRQFVAVFRKWSKTINLVAASTESRVVQRHIADSLQLVDLDSRPKQWVDLGSGGGFPGLITAIALAQSGEGWVDLIESNRKKAAFLRAAIDATGARASVHPVRVEAASLGDARVDAVSARAVMTLDRLLDLSARWLAGSPTCEGWFHKGRDYRREIHEARGRWRFDLVNHPSRLEPDSVILQIRNVERLDDAQPVWTRHGAQG